VALSASARARTAGATPGWCAPSSFRAVVEPGQAFPQASPPLPQWLQRRRQRQGHLGVGGFAAPRERGAQIVDLEVRLLDALLIISASRGVEPGR